MKTRKQFSVVVDYKILERKSKHWLYLFKIS